MCQEQFERPGPPWPRRWPTWAPSRQVCPFPGGLFCWVGAALTVAALPQAGSHPRQQTSPGQLRGPPLRRQPPHQPPQGLLQLCVSPQEGLLPSVPAPSTEEPRNIPEDTAGHKALEQRRPRAPPTRPSWGHSLRSWYSAQEALSPQDEPMSKILSLSSRRRPLPCHSCPNRVGRRASERAASRASLASQRFQKAAQSESAAW